MASVTKVPITIKVSYELLREWMLLPSDVEMLGVVGAHDLDGTIAVIVETPVYHIKGANLTAQYERTEGGTKFKGFA